MIFLQLGVFIPKIFVKRIRAIIPNSCNGDSNAAPNASLLLLEPSVFFDGVIIFVNTIYIRICFYFLSAIGSKTKCIFREFE